MPNIYRTKITNRKTPSTTLLIMSDPNKPSKGLLAISGRRKNYALAIKTENPIIDAMDSLLISSSDSPSETLAEYDSESIPRYRVSANAKMPLINGNLLGFPVKISPMGFTLVCIFP